MTDAIMNDLKRRIQTILRERRRLSRDRQILQVWSERTPNIQDADEPQIVFGEPIDKLDDLQQTADNNYTSQGKEIPGGLAQKIEHFTRKIQNRSAQLELKVLEKNKINEQYDRDLSPGVLA